MNFKFYPKAHIVNVFEKCFQVNIPELGKNGWFKLKHLVPAEYCKKCIFNIRGFYIDKEELYRKKILPTEKEFCWDQVGFEL